MLRLERCVVVVAAGLLGLAPRARAEGFDGQRYLPAAGAAGGFAVERTLVPHHLDWGVGLFLHYADDAVVIEDADGDVVAEPLSQALTFDLVASIGLFDVAELALHLPIALVHDGEPGVVGGEAFAAEAGVGDLRVVPKLSLVRTRSFGAGVALPIRLPTGDDLALRGSPDLTLEPKLLLSFGAGRLAFGLNVGYLAHTTSEGREGLGGDELTFAGSLRYRLPTAGEDIALHLEAFGGWNPGDEPPAYHELPVEALLGAIFGLSPRWDLYAAASTGVSDGVGAPDFRVLVGVRYNSVGFSDRDADGILDDRDRCPERAEDRDDYQDEDGCPEGDNDGDGIPDQDDECPDAREDAGGGDRDGCPARGRAEYRKGRMHVYGKIRFRSDSAELLPSSDPILDDVARDMKRHKEIRKLRVEGHSDNQGDAGYNRKLSTARARSVRAALIRRGVAPQRLDAVGYGEARPVTSNRSERGRAKNRRVELRVVR
jgi:outer membrane protein OmpA-like peptidoglycan-associated protein